MQPLDALDGVKPRHAACVHCGYQFGGVPIRARQITCPECGKVSRFALEPPARRRPGWATPARVAAWAVVMLLLALAILTRRH